MRLVSAIGLGLVAITLIAFWPAGRNDFVDYDDPDYVTANDHVRSGLTWPGAQWAFQSTEAANWHPVTWLSHMLDCQLYGLKPRGHHLTSVLLHAVNSLLVFLVLRRMTGAVWRSALVAALFALHPMHVESVAWVAERKDVLSGLFFLLTLWAYGRYAEFKIKSLKLKMGERMWYGAALIFFALGLMSKPMLVTLPVILVLLDFWPLGRFRPAAAGGPAGSGAPSGNATSVGRLILEKLPFFALAAAASIVTFVAQHKAGVVGSFEQLPLDKRIDNALVSYSVYLGKAFWPENLSAFYPYHEIPAWQAIGAGLLLIVVSVLVIRQARTRPYLAVGWAWLFVMLVPVIGLVQVGAQSMADRYTYLPFIGLFLALSWWLADLTPASAAGRRGVVLGVAAALAACLVHTRAQVQYWKNDLALFSHAVAVTSQNAVAENNLGSTLYNSGDKAGALEHIQIALAILPAYWPAQYNLGSYLLAEGKYDEAETHLRSSLQIHPTAAAHHDLGTILILRGKHAEAEAQFRAALQMQPALIETRCSLGSVLAMQGKNEEAEALLLESVRRQPGNAKLHQNLGNVLVTREKLAEAETEYSTAIQLNPTDATLRESLGGLFLKRGQPDKALAQLQEALKLQPNPKVHATVAIILAQRGDVPGAIHHYSEALRLQPEAVTALNNLAWILATSPDATLRDGARAVRLAERACELSQYKQTMMVGTLAAAYAEAGRFAEAVATAEKACSLASEAGAPALLRKNQELLDLYRANKPYHEPAGINP